MAMMMRVLPGERARFAALASLLFIHSFVIESNEVVAISGFVSSVGVTHIPWLWAADALIVICFSSGYTLVVDRMKRGRLAASLFFGFSLAYVVLSVLFALDRLAWLRYPLLLVMNNQQWRLVPLLIWALANDMFSIAEAKRLFPLLGIAGIAGEMAGNGLAAGIAHWVGGNNAGLLLIA